MAATDGQLPNDILGYRSEGLYAPGIGTVAQQGVGVTVDSTGTPSAATVISGVVQSATKNIAVAAGSGTTPITIKSSAGYLKCFVVTTTATAAMTFYDNASAASGTILYVTSTSIAAGTIVVLDMPFLNGLTVSQASGSAAVTIAYS